MSRAFGFFVYREQDGKTPVCTIVICRPEEKEAAAGDRTRVIRALAAASLVYRHAQCLQLNNRTVVPPRAERWVVFTQGFRPKDDMVVLGEGYSEHWVRIDEFLELEPLSADDRMRRLDEAITGMAEVLSHEAENDDELGAALDLLVEGAKTADQHIRRLNFTRNSL